MYLQQLSLTTNSVIFNLLWYTLFNERTCHFSTSTRVLLCYRNKFSYGRVMRGRTWLSWDRVYIYIFIYISSGYKIKIINIIINKSLTTLEYMFAYLHEDIDRLEHCTNCVFLRALQMHWEQFPKMRPCDLIFSGNCI